MKLLLPWGRLQTFEGVVDGLLTRIGRGYMKYACSVKLPGAILQEVKYTSSNKPLLVHYTWAATIIIRDEVH